jgi:hypothetical protein
MANLPKELKHFLARYDEQPQSLALTLREIVVQELAPCHEYIFAIRSKVVLAFVDRRDQDGPAEWKAAH